MVKSSHISRWKLRDYFDLAMCWVLINQAKNVISREKYAVTRVQDGEAAITFEGNIKSIHNEPCCDMQVVQHELVLCRMVLRLWHVESVAAGGQASHGSSVFELFDMIAVN
ncbi:hypothetical protein PI125_g10624 [Phytophthora idaei]|nr:hypothetical protein PI125_g10624 [Phytophthora idaei]KAG3153630.1 hypothetical protein PI126_g9993 [Phytophthora idaei]